jgi:hypothetical protein
LHENAIGDGNTNGGRARLPQQNCSHVGRFATIALLLALAMAFDAVVNYQIPHGFWSANRWSSPPTFPASRTNAKGFDLQIFVEASSRMVHGENPLHANYNSPPFTALFYYPFTWLDFKTAFAVNFSFVIAANLLFFGLLVDLLRRVTQRDVSRSTPDPLVLPLLALTALFCIQFQFRSYGFEFALERGNYDSFALLATGAGIYFALLNPQSIWLPLICFSLATHLKVYPALFLILLFLYRGKRVLLPMLALNIALLFCFGFRRGIEFLIGLYRYSHSAYLWKFNHSAFSFSVQFFERLFPSGLGPGVIHIISMFVLVGVPVALWVHGIVRLRDSANFPRTGILIAALSMPLFSFIPSVSHDYKLVIQILPLFIGIFYFSLAYLQSGNWRSLSGIVLILLCAALLARSTRFPNFPFLDNKYLALLLLQCLIYSLILSEHKPARRSGSLSRS